MNKILVSREGIVCDSDRVDIDGNNIRLLDNDIYLLEYIDIEDINICISINGVKVKLFEYSVLGNINVNNKYIINNGELLVNKFYNNDKVVENIDIDLCSEGAKIDYKFSNICKNDESYMININHNSKKTVSSINNKSIAMDNSKLKFVINSIVKKEYEGSVLDQNTRIITIGDSDSSISPNMYIDCDDIEARHGSIIGTFNDDMIFYLMSRGINYNDAIKLLVKGYLFSNIDVDSIFRERILNVIDMYWR